MPSKTIADTRKGQEKVRLLWLFVFNRMFVETSAERRIPVLYIVKMVHLYSTENLMYF